jgi:BTB/POZ domain-containing protein 9
LVQKPFFTLSAEILADILSSDSFAAPELDIFKVVIKWIEQNPGEDIKSVTSKLRLYLISFKDLLNVVRKSGKISEASLMEVMKMKAKRNGLIYYLKKINSFFNVKSF